MIPRGRPCCRAGYGSTFRSRHANFPHVPTCFVFDTRRSLLAARTSRFGPQSFIRRPRHGNQFRAVSLGSVVQFRLDTLVMVANTARWFVSRAGTPLTPGSAVREVCECKLLTGLTTAFSAGVATSIAPLLFMNGLLPKLANLSAALANVCSRSFHCLSRQPSLIDGLGIPFDFPQALMAANRRNLVHRATSLS
jgi:hypothetical protein